jgi:hypothetical protein
MICRHTKDRIRAWLTLLVLLVVGLALSGEQARAVEGHAAPSPTGEVSGAPQDAGETLCCQRLTAMIEQQKALISRETGQLKRELAALREELKKPGMREILAGIGYIFGLAGVGLYLQAQKPRYRRFR